MFIFRFMRMVEVGIAQREEKKWKTKKPVCQKSITNSGAVTFFEVIPSLWFLSAGILLSFFVFLVELLSMRFQQKSTRYSSNFTDFIKSCSLERNELLKIF